MGARVLFLCTGNICRSPFAEVVARDRFEGLGLEFVSAGLDAPSGRPASRGSAICAERQGLDLSAHRSRPVTKAVLENTAWAIGMTRGHAALLRSRCSGRYTGAIGFLGAPGVDLAAGGPSPEGEEVPDPYGGELELYEATCARIRRLVEGWEPVFSILSRAEGARR